jgi:thioester reductase-like protein
MAKPANVEGAREILKLATRKSLKLVSYISTLSIFESSVAGTGRTVAESTTIEHERHSSSQGYVASKWVGEKIFLTAAARGIPCNIIRLGLIWADSQRGRYDELQNGYRLLKSCLLSGSGIENYRYEMPPTPVDYAARAIVFLTDKHRQGLGVFHISSSSQTVDDLFERCNEVAGTSFEILSPYDWICRIKRLDADGQVLPIVPLVAYAFSLDEASFYNRRRAIEAVNTHIDCSSTQHELEEAGITTPVFGDELLRTCVEGMLAMDPDLHELATGGGNVPFVNIQREARADRLG